MKKLLVIFLTLLALVGCKAEGEKNAIENTDLNGIKAPVPRNYSASEVMIGKRICNALKTKRLEFGNLSSTALHQFRFRGDLKKCGGGVYGSGLFVADVKNDSADYQYVAVSSRPDYFKDVVTDDNGVMKVLCENFNVSDNVSNTVLIDNASFAISFLIRDGFDRFEVTKKINGGIISSESVNVITQANQAQNKHYGVEKERMRSTVCPGTKDYSFTKQTWIEAVAGF